MRQRSPGAYWMAMFFVLILILGTVATALSAFL